MFNYKEIANDEELVVDFRPCVTTEDCVRSYSAYKRGTDEEVGAVNVTNGTFDAFSDTDIDVFTQYKLWQTRPERKVGQIVVLEGKNLEQLAEEYDELIVGAQILSQNLNIVPGSKQPYETMLDWLRGTDFYTAPASTYYHDSVPGGLLVHSLNVYNNMIKLHDTEVFENVNLAEATIVALVHDWCKIGFYESYKRNIKDPGSGQWEEVTAYRVNQRGIPLGHGVTSLYIAMKLFKLSVEQALAIRWHMSAWSVAEVEKPELQKANAEYPMVYLIQFADQLAATEYC